MPPFVDVAIKVVGRLWHIGVLVVLMLMVGVSAGDTDAFNDVVGDVEQAEYAVTVTVPEAPAKTCMVLVDALPLHPVGTFHT